MKIDVGLTEQSRKKVADGLCKVLADTSVLYIKTHNFHWNVTGPRFYSLHLLFEQQYTDLQTAVDGIAERIRALGHPAPGSYAQFLQLTSIKEAKDIPAAEEMVKQLAADHEEMVRSLRKFFEGAEQVEDATTEDLLTQRLEVHEKAAWMLRSSL